MLKLAIQSEQNHSPLQKQLYQLFQEVFRAQNHIPIRSFMEHYAGVDILVVHLSCRPRGYLAHQSAMTFVDPKARIRNVIIMGHEAGKSGAYHFDPSSGILVVPAKDTYEGLAEKSAATYAFLEFAGADFDVLKVDDDIKCLRADHLLDHILPWIRSQDYGGKVWHASLGFSRTWHMGKCADPTLNLKPYGLLANASYAEGPAYFLSVRALHVLGKSAIYMENLFETEGGYEDLAVGKVLNHYGIMPVNIDFIKEGILGSVDRWMMQRAGLEQ